MIREPTPTSADARSSAFSPTDWRGGWKQITLSHQRATTRSSCRSRRDPLAAVRPPAKPMLTVEDICTTFQVSRAWVYENAGLTRRIQTRALATSTPSGSIPIASVRCSETAHPTRAGEPPRDIHRGAAVGIEGGRSTSPGLRWLIDLRRRPQSGRIANTDGRARAEAERTNPGVPQSNRGRDVHDFAFPCMAGEINVRSGYRTRRVEPPARQAQAPADNQRVRSGSLATAGPRPDPARNATHLSRVRDGVARPSGR